MSGKQLAYPEIDVIIPVFNGASYLEQAVRSAAAQTLRPGRIIIVDDGSEDATPTVAKKLASELAFVTYLRQPHRGVSAARNAGLGESSSPFVAFLDADDFWSVDKLSKQAAIFQSSGEELALVYCDYRCVDTAGRPIPGRDSIRPTLRGRVFRELLAGDNAVSGSASAVLIRRSCLDQVGGFDERLYYGEDWDLWLRIATVGAFDYAPEKLVHVRIHGGSAQNRQSQGRQLGFLAQHLLIYSKWPAEVALLPELPRSLRRRAALLAVLAWQNPREVTAFMRTVRETRVGPQGPLFSGWADFARESCAALARHVAWQTGLSKLLRSGRLGEKAGSP